jgi:hypothetical protein
MKPLLLALVLVGCSCAQVDSTGHLMPFPRLLPNCEFYLLTFGCVFFACYCSLRSRLTNLFIVALAIILSTMIFFVLPAIDSMYVPHGSISQQRR